MYKNFLLDGAKKGDPTPEIDKPIDNKLRYDWNKYLEWLDSKKMKGHPDLDKNDLGGKMIDQYKKENSSTLVSRESITPIQKEFQKYREYALNEIANKRGEFAPGTDKENFLRHLSIIDGIPGQRTTQFSFPKNYLIHLDQQRKVAGVDNKGFVNTSLVTK